jgi:ParB family chromosome partitioning protein
MMKEQTKQVKLSELMPFSGSPFKDIDTTAIDELAESIQNAGLIVPPIVREHGDGYELISGLRRKLACEQIGLTEIPVIVRDLDDDAAAIAHVDSNLIGREHILPSERAFAYKLKYDALKHQGKTLGHSVHKSRDEITDDMSGRNVTRYIRLTELIPELLELVDAGTMAMRPAVELSYLPPEEQKLVFAACEDTVCTPSHPQAIRLRRYSQGGHLDQYKALDVMSEEKPNQQLKLNFRMNDIKKYFPKSYTPQRMQEVIIRLLEQWQRHRERERNAR